MSANAWMTKLNVTPEDGCRCGHNAYVHLHGKSCTAVIDESRMWYCKCEVFHLAISYENQNEGESEMAKKAKHAKKQARAPRGEKLYEAFSSKISASEFGKKAADKECTSHTPLVAQVLIKAGKAISFDRVVELVRETKRYKSSNLEHCVRGDLGILVRAELVKTASIEAKEPAAKRKRAPKVRTAKQAMEVVERAVETAATA